MMRTVRTALAALWRHLTPWWVRRTIDQLAIGALIGGAVGTALLGVAFGAAAVGALTLTGVYWGLTWLAKDKAEALFRLEQRYSERDLTDFCVLFGLGLALLKFIIL